MRTAIFTSQPTTLFIATRETLNLEQMGHEGAVIAPIKLRAGENKVPVGFGVFRILSRSAVSVTTENADLQVMSTPSEVSNKEEDWPDPTRGFADINRDDLNTFFGSRSGAPPA